MTIFVFCMSPNVLIPGGHFLGDSNREEKKGRGSVWVFLTVKLLPLITRHVFSKDVPQKKESDAFVYGQVNIYNHHQRMLQCFFIGNFMVIKTCISFYERLRTFLVFKNKVLFQFLFLEQLIILNIVDIWAGG